METEYAISEDDYLRAMRLFARITPKIALFYAGGIVILLLAAAFGSPVIRGGAIGGLIVAIFIVVVERLLLGPILARRQYRKYKAIQEPVRVRLMDDGVQFSNADGSGVIRWDKIHKWRQDGAYLLIYLMPRMYYIIPKSVRDSGFELDRLIASLRANVGNES